MRRSVRKGFVVFAVMGLSFSMVSSAFAEASNSERSVTGFFRRLFNYPVKATQETAGMTANTLQNAGEKIVEPIAKDTTAVLTGQPEKVADLVAEPTKGTLETAGQTASETAQVPVKAAEEESSSTK